MRRHHGEVYKHHYTKVMNFTVFNTVKFILTRERVVLPRAVTMLSAAALVPVAAAGP